jgi:uncharacterized protein YqiB (DUF1249 family)
MKNRFVVAGLLIILTVFSYLYASHAVSMWQTALLDSRDASIAMGAFIEASQWLSQNLKQDEIVVVPSPEVFRVLNPELRDRLIDYKSIWRAAGVELRERGDIRRIQSVRDYLIDFLQGNWSIKYVVRDWGEVYVRSLFDAAVNDELMLLLREAKVVPFTLSTGWSSKMTVYEVVRYTTLFNAELSYPPRNYFMYPSNASIQFDSSGATIQKPNWRVGFYLPLEARIDTSRQNYLTAQIQLEAENIVLLMAFYFDKDGDGEFTSYERDEATSIILNQTKLGWARGRWYTIYQTLPKSIYPIVQIGIVAPGEKSATIRLSGLVVHSEITPSDVQFEASNWLSENLGAGESALVPSPALYSYKNPELRGKLMDYRSLWVSAGTTLQANTTQVLNMRRSLISSLEGNSSVKYIVRDWVNPYAERIFDLTVSDELMFLLRAVKAVFFTFSGGWSRTITIYEVVRYTNVLAMNFSSPPKRYFMYPSNASIQFGSDGATIQKTVSQVRFYVPLATGINVSRPCYFSIQFKPDVDPIDDLVLWIAFYFDQNGNGFYDGPSSTDYVALVIFDKTKLNWVKGEWVITYQSIPPPRADKDPIVQIGIITLGNVTGAITISSLTMHTEQASPT